MCRICQTPAPTRTRVCSIDHQRTRELVDLKRSLTSDLDKLKKGNIHKSCGVESPLQVKFIMSIRILTRKGQKLTQK